MHKSIHIVHNESETADVAEAIAPDLRPGDIIWLVGDVGSGKTTFVRALLKAFGLSGEVSSPTFTLSHIYETKELDFYHYDLYRLSDLGLIEYELKEIIAQPRAVLLVEWPHISSEHLSATKTIIFKRMVEGKSWRKIVVSSNSHEYHNEQKHE